ncbi:MAG TPA: DUF3667 domain-containing protein [Saprospiraceae bacterium]|nr:DUF3667 domain-containing protein [Saprospiraceae bacterium]
MTQETQKEKCKYCHHEVSNHFCANCGRPRKLTKIDGPYILSEIGDVLNLKKGFLFTVRELVLRPGLSVRKYMLEDRRRLVKPIVFVIVCSLIYSLLRQWLGFEDGYVGVGASDWKDSAVLAVFEWISKNYGYINVLMAVFVAFWIKIFFRKYGYNFFEILVLLWYVMGVGMLLFAILGIFDSLTGLKVLDTGSILLFIYLAWGIGQFFDKKKKINYLKAFFAYMLGMITFMVFAMGVGLLIDWWVK